MSFATWLSSLVQPLRRPNRKVSGRPVPSARPRTTFSLERLEDRTVPADHIWTGAGLDALWSNPANWSGGAPTVTEGTDHDSPVKLIFGGASKKLSIQNIPNLIVDQIRFSDSGYNVQINSPLTLREFDNNNPTNKQIFSMSTSGATNVISGISSITTMGDDPEILVDGAGVALQISARLGGSNGYGKTGLGTLTLSGANTFAGGFGVDNGTVKVKSNTALGSTAGVTGVNEGATLDVQANIGAERLIFLSDNSPPANGNFLITSAGAGVVGGPIQLNIGQNDPEFLKVGGAGALTISGPISGNGGLTKIGAGSTTLSGTNTYSGETQLTAGFLRVIGTQDSSAVSVTGGTLFGTGVIGSLTATAGTFASFNGSSGAPLRVQGDVALSGVALRAYRLGSAVVVGQTVVIIDNQGANPVNGAFAGAPEGGTVTDYTGQKFRISYVGGDGNDITLKALTVGITAPRITRHPLSQTRYAFGPNTSSRTAVFTVAFSTGTTVPVGTIQWQVSLNGGRTYANLPYSAATRSTYSFRVTRAMNNRIFRAVVKNAVGTTNSLAARLRVL